MKEVSINDYQIHSNTNNPNGIYLHAPLDGLGFPELRTSSYNKPGEHGAFVSNNLYGGRRILITGSIVASTLASYETNRREFIKQLAIIKDSSNILTPTVMKLLTLDSLQLQLNVHLREATLNRVNILGDQFLLDFFAPDFFIESQSQSSSTITVSSGGGAVYPVTYPVTYDATTGGTEIVVNNGTAEAYPVIVINGPIINPILENTTVGRYIELSQTILSGETVTIDMINRTIVKGTQSIIGQKTSASQFWYLASGSNVIRFLTGNTSDTGNMQITFRDSYLGV